jgi:HEAT repeat protein
MENLDVLIGELSSGNDQRAEAAVNKIRDYGEGALDRLEELLEAPEADLRWWATWAASGVSSPRTGLILRKRLKDPDLTVRQCAALGLRQNPDLEAIPVLMACLEDEDPTLIHLSAAALAAIGEQAVPHMLELFKNSSLPTRLAILRALGTVRDERAIPILFEALDDDSALIEHWANEGLEKMGIGMKFFKPS